MISIYFIVVFAFLILCLHLMAIGLNLRAEKYLKQRNAMGATTIGDEDKKVEILLKGLRCIELGDKALKYAFALGVALAVHIILTHFLIGWG